MIGSKRRVGTGEVSTRICTTCGEWRVGDTDLYCSNCGQLQLGVELTSDRWMLLVSIPTARQTLLTLKNTDSKPVHVQLQPEHRRSWIGHSPGKLRIPPGNEGEITVKLLAGQIPASFQSQRLVYSLVFNGKKHLRQRFEIEVKGPPRPTAAPLDFGELQEDIVVERRLQISNTGGIPCLIEDVKPLGSSQLQVGELPSSRKVEAGTAVSVPVRWDTRKPEQSQSQKRGFQIHFKHGDSLFVPARGAPIHYRLLAEPERLHLDLPARGTATQTFELSNQGTVDLEVTSIDPTEHWIEIHSPELPVALKAPVDAEGQVGANSISLAARIHPETLEPGVNYGEIEIGTADDLEPLRLPIELRVHPVETLPEYIGIDFGTTQSVVAVMNPRTNAIELVEVEVPPDQIGSLGSDTQPEGEAPADSTSPLIPSVLVFTGDEGQHVIGHDAKRQMEVLPGRAIRSIKRILGFDEGWRGPDRTYQPHELAALILKKLIDLAARKLFQLTKTYYDIPRAIVTIPAAFYDLQSEKILEACELAGLDADQGLRGEAAREIRESTGAEIQDSTLLAEPSAAALYLLYHLAEETSLDNELQELSTREGGMNLLVFDYGGGTLDISVANVSQLKNGGLGLRILANCGNNRIGGDHLDFRLMKEQLPSAQNRFPDFDSELIRASHQEIQERRREEGWSVEVWTAVGAARLHWKDAAEKLKILLSTEGLQRESEVSVELPAHAILYVEGGRLVTASEPLTLTSSRQELEEQLKEPLNQAGSLLQQALDLADLQASEIDFVFHAGRQSFMPTVRALVAEAFPAVEERKRILLDKKLIKVCVAKGAALFGRLRHRQDSEAAIRLIQERRLPHAYGVDRSTLFGGLEFEEVIAQGESYPVEREKCFTSLPGNGLLRVSIYQNNGQGSKIKENEAVQLVGTIEHPFQPGSVKNLTLRLAVDLNRRLTAHLADKQVEIQPLELSNETEWMG